MMENVEAAAHDFDLLLGFGQAAPKAFSLNRLGADTPQSKIAAILDSEASLKNLFPANYRRQLIDILNRAVLANRDRSVPAKESDGGSIRNYDQQKNRLVAYLELDDVRIAALLAAHYRWPDTLSERNLIRAWFTVTAKPPEREHSLGT